MISKIQYIIIIYCCLNGCVLSNIQHALARGFVMLPNTAEHHHAKSMGWGGVVWGYVCFYASAMVHLTFAPPVITHSAVDIF